MMIPDDHNPYLRPNVRKALAAYALDANLPETGRNAVLERATDAAMLVIMEGGDIDAALCRGCLEFKLNLQESELLTADEEVRERLEYYAQRSGNLPVDIDEAVALAVERLLEGNSKEEALERGMSFIRESPQERGKYKLLRPDIRVMMREIRELMRLLDC